MQITPGLFYNTFVLITLLVITITTLAVAVASVAIKFTSIVAGITSTINIPLSHFKVVESNDGIHETVYIVGGSSRPLEAKTIEHLGGVVVGRFYETNLS